MSTNRTAAYTPTYALKLGTVQFLVDDLPTDLQFEGQRLVTVRQFAGGNVVAQDLGPYDPQIEWSGTFRYGNALQRALAVNAIRLAGQPVTLQTIGGIKRKVVVSDYKYTPYNAYRVGYDITVIPVDVPGSGGVMAQIVTVGPTVRITLATSTKKGTASPPTAAAASTGQSATRTTRYVVQAGDNLWSLAAKFLGGGTNWGQIYTANNLATTVLQPGQVLQIPTKG